MERNCKLQIYKGMIQYLLDSTNYSLKNIAELSNSSINNIQSIYYHNYLPNGFKSGIYLTNLHQIILEINKN